MKRYHQAMRTLLLSIMILSFVSAPAVAAWRIVEDDGVSPCETLVEKTDKEAKSAAKKGTDKAADEKKTAVYFKPYSTVSGDVEQYSETIQLYTSMFSIPEYSELVKAVMMQESKGSGKDPMQASESGYNVLYPKRPNGITDPEYSVEVGAYALCVALSLSGAQGPDDYEGVALALQAYNYGAGYISWALENYGGYSKLNAVEYSEIMSEKLGWPGYGDRNYVSHVLQWYSFPEEARDNPNQLILEVIHDQLGKTRWTASMEDADPDNADLSALFVTWCADRAGCFQFGTMPKCDSAEKARDWFSAKGKWKDKDWTPVPGDILFMDRDSDGQADYMAFIDRVEDGVVHTVEADPATLICITNQYEIASALILGFGHPIY